VRRFPVTAPRVWRARVTFLGERCMSPSGSRAGVRTVVWEGRSAFSGRMVVEEVVERPDGDSADGPGSRSDDGEADGSQAVGSGTDKAARNRRKKDKKKQRRARCKQAGGEAESVEPEAGEADAGGEGALAAAGQPTKSTAGATGVADGAVVFRRLIFLDSPSTIQSEIALLPATTAAPSSAATPYPSDVGGTAPAVAAVTAAGGSSPEPVLAGGGATTVAVTPALLDRVPDHDSLASAYQQALVSCPPALMRRLPRRAAIAVRSSLSCPQLTHLPSCLRRFVAYRCSPSRRRCGLA